MASEHDTFIEKLVALGAHLEHPDAKALWNKLKGVIEAGAEVAVAEFPKMLYRDKNTQVVHSAEEEAAAVADGFDNHPNHQTASSDAPEPE